MGCRPQETDRGPDPAGGAGAVLYGGEHPPARHILRGQPVGLHCCCQGNCHHYAAHWAGLLILCVYAAQDWDSVISLLLDEKAGIVLTGQEEATLIEILSCAVCRAVGAGTPPARTRGKVCTS